MNKTEAHAIEDIGILAETWISNGTRINANESNKYGILIAHMVKENKIRTGGVSVYYRKSKVELSNVEIRNDLEQIYCSVKSEQHKLEFNLCAFYVRNSNEEAKKILVESVKIWDKKIKEEKPFLAIGDNNLYYHMNSKQEVIEIDTNGTIYDFKEFRQFIIRNNFKQ